MSSKNDFLNNIGSDKFEVENTLNALEKLGIEFRLKCIELLNSRGVTASGKLDDSISDPIIKESGTVTTMTITLADYYDYTNKGVKGWADSKKAPRSPYQFKTKGMSAAGRKSITQYIQSGRKKVQTFAKYGSYGKLEEKMKKYKNSKDRLKFQVDNAVFGIKRYGIEAKYWFDDAVKEVFGDFEVIMAEQFGKDISVTFETKGK